MQPFLLDEGNFSPPPRNQSHPDWPGHSVSRFISARDSLLVSLPTYLLVCCPTSLLSRGVTTACRLSRGTRHTSSLAVTPPLLPYPSPGHTAPAQRRTVLNPDDRWLPRRNGERLRTRPARRSAGVGPPLVRETVLAAVLVAGRRLRRPAR